MRGSASAMTADTAATAPESAPRLSVSLVGRFGLKLNGQPLELRTRKAAAVLSYLALSETKKESAEAPSPKPSGRAMRPRSTRSPG